MSRSLSETIVRCADTVFINSEEREKPRKTNLTLLLWWHRLMLGTSSVSIPVYCILNSRIRVNLWLTWKLWRMLCGPSFDQVRSEIFYGISVLIPHLYTLGDSTTLIYWLEREGFYQLSYQLSYFSNLPSLSRYPTSSISPSPWIRTRWETAIRFGTLYLRRKKRRGELSNEWKRRGLTSWASKIRNPFRCIIYKKFIILFDVIDQGSFYNEDIIWVSSYTSNESQTNYSIKKFSYFLFD